MAAVHIDSTLQTGMASVYTLVKIIHEINKSYFLLASRHRLGYMKNIGISSPNL